MKLSGSTSTISRVVAVISVFSFLAFSVVFNLNGLNLNSDVYAGHANNPNFCIENPTHNHCVSTSTPTSTPTTSPTGSSTPTATATASATPHGVQRIRICHTTDSHSNPYTNPQVDQDAADGFSGNDNGQGDHYLEHNGPIWYQGIPDHSWGDIIPPVPANGNNPGHNGKNWNSQGQSIWNNSCNIVTEVDPTPTPTATPDSSDTPAPTPTLSPAGAPDNGTGGGGQVLGASTMATAGTGEDLLSMIFAIGSFSFGMGIRKYTYAFSSQK